MGKSSPERHLEEYKGILKAEGKAESSINLYAGFLSKTLNGSLYNGTEDFLRTFFGTKDFAPATFNLYRAIFNGFLDWGVSAGYIDSNPMKKIRIKVKNRRSLPKPLSEETWNGFYGRTEGWFRIVCGLMRYGGLRLSESARVTRGDLQRENNLFWVRVENGKGGADRDAIIFDEGFCAELQDYIEPMDENDRLSLGRSTSTIRGRFQLISGRMGENVHPHLLRHTYATELVNKGTPLELVKLMLGHVRLDTTLIYAKVRPERILSYLS